MSRITLQNASAHAFLVPARQVRVAARRPGRAATGPSAARSLALSRWPIQSSFCCSCSQRSEAVAPQTSSDRSFLWPEQHLADGDAALGAVAKPQQHGRQILDLRMSHAAPPPARSCARTCRAAAREPVLRATTVSRSASTASMRSPLTCSARSHQCEPMSRSAELAPPLPDRAARSRRSSSSQPVLKVLPVYEAERRRYRRGPPSRAPAAPAGCRDS